MFNSAWCLRVWELASTKSCFKSAKRSTERIADFFKFSNCLYLSCYILLHCGTMIVRKTLHGGVPCTWQLPVPASTESSNFGKINGFPALEQKRLMSLRPWETTTVMLAQDPDIIAKLKKKRAGARSKKKESNCPLTASLSNQELGDESEVTQSYHFGHSLIRRLWGTLKLDQLFAKIVGKRDQQEVLDMIFYLLIHRLMDPSSILDCSKDQVNFAGIAEMKLDRLYDVLDVLDESKDAISSRIWPSSLRRTPLGKQPWLLRCYDLRL